MGALSIAALLAGQAGSANCGWVEFKSHRQSAVGTAVKICPPASEGKFVFKHEGTVRFSRKPAAETQICIIRTSNREKIYSSVEGFSFQIDTELGIGEYSIRSEIQNDSDKIT